MMESLARLRRLRSPSSEARPIEDLDNAIHFFMDCWHLKDWLKRDPAGGVTQDEVEDFANSDSTLMVCAVWGGKRLSGFRPPRA